MTPLPPWVYIRIILKCTRFSDRSAPSDPSIVNLSDIVEISEIVEISCPSGERTMSKILGGVLWPTLFWAGFRAAKMIKGGYICILKLVQHICLSSGAPFRKIITLWGLQNINFMLNTFNMGHFPKNVTS